MRIEHCALNRQLLPLDAHALAIAKDAYANHFESRRGTGDWATGFQGRDGRGRFARAASDGFYIYDNPWASDPELREAQYSELVTFMAKRGCHVMGASYCPEVDGGDPDAGYTLALVFVSSDRASAQEDHDAAKEVISRFMNRTIKLALAPSPAAS